MIHIVKNEDKEKLTKFYAWIAKLPENWHENHTDWWKKLTENTSIKKELQTALLEEQGYICCYCCRSITNENTSEIVVNNPKENPKENVLKISIEHFLEKTNHPQDTFKYVNLLASCDAKGSCNLKRNNKTLHLNPQDKNSVALLYCEKIKQNIDIQSKEPQYQEEIGVEVLNLNNSGLRNARNVVFQTIKSNIEELMKEKTDKEIVEFISNKYATKQQAKFKYDFPFLVQYALEYSGCTTE